MFKMLIDRMQIVVSRKWNQPQIHVNVDGEGIEIKMDMNDFIIAIKNEIKLPKLRLQTKTSSAQKELELSTSLDEAIETVIKEMKDATLQVAEY